MAFEYGIPPDVLLRQSPRMFWTMERYLYWRAVKQQESRRKR